MKSRALVVVATLVMNAQAMAADSGQLAGAGTITCTEYINAYGANPKTAESQFYNWAQGYMSGFNIGIISMLDAKGPYAFRDLTSNPERNQQRIRNYCVTNPTAYYFHAVLDLFDSLPLIKKSN